VPRIEALEVELRGTFVFVREPVAVEDMRMGMDLLLFVLRTDVDSVLVGFRADVSGDECLD
jgi:hypothetical protein